MPIKLNGATSGSVELDVPAAVGSDLQLTLPATAGDVVVKAADGSVDLGNMVIDAGGILKTNGVKNIYESFFITGNATYNWDFTVPAEGSWGNSFYLIAGFNHYYNTAYGAHRTCWFSARGTSVGAMGNGISQSHAQSGGWTFSKPNSTTVRITKTAGTLDAPGYGFFQLKFNDF